MFNPEKMLGSLLGGLIRGGGVTPMKAQIGMGLMGVAMEAFEHYTNKSSAPPPPGGHGVPMGAPPPSPPGGRPPMPPTATATPPPPPPGQTASFVPPVPPAALPNSLSSAQKDAVLLIRAMIAAANADGHIDQEERQRILAKFQEGELSPEEQSFLNSELLNPAGIEQLASEVRSLEIARQVYTASLLAITVDTTTERSYLQTLSSRLALSPEECRTIHATLGIEDF